MTAAEPRKLTRPLTRIDGVDLLRGLAIFFVLMNHVNMRLRLARIPYTKGLPEQLVHSLVWNGQLGVQIFFAISGFLITATAIRRWGSLSRVNIRGFYRFRFARIAPLLLLLLAVLSALHLAQVNHYVVGAKTGGLGRALAAALTFHINVLEATRGYLPANWDILWSLSVEEMFYLGFPLLCVLTRGGKWLVAVLALFVALGPVARTVWSHGNEVWREYSYLGGMDAIALGCLTAMALERAGTFSARTLRVLAIVGAVLVIFSLCFTMQAQKIGLTRAGLDMTVLAIGTCMLIAAAAQAQWRSPRWITPLRLVGQRSYEVYLVHMFVVFVFFDLFLSIGKPIAAVPVLFLATILVSAVAGELVARFYSEPMNRRLREHA